MFMRWEYLCVVLFLLHKFPAKEDYVMVVRMVCKVLAKIPGSALTSVEGGKWFLSQEAVNQWISFHTKTDINFYFSFFLF